MLVTSTDSCCWHCGPFVVPVLKPLHYTKDYYIGWLEKDVLHECRFSELSFSCKIGLEIALFSKSILNVLF